MKIQGVDADDIYPFEFALELLESAAKKENIRIEWIRAPWNDLFEMLMIGEIDAIPSLVKTVKRSKKMNFTETSLFRTWSSLYISSDTKFSSILQLEKKKIAIIKNDNNGQGFIRYIESFNIYPDFIEFLNFENAIDALISHEVFGFASSASELFNIELKTIRSSGLYFNPVDMSIAFSKQSNPLLLEKIDSRLSIMKQDSESEYYALLEAYNLLEWKEIKDDIPSWIFPMLTLLFFVALISIIFVLVLKKQIRTKTTALLHKEKQLQQAQKMESIGQLAGGVAHDFNNMLGAIIGIAEILESDLEEKPELKEFSSQIIQTAERAGVLTKQLLAFARKGPSHFTVVDINDLIQQVVSIAERTFNKSITFQIKLEADETIIEGDDALIQNILFNLLINGRDAMQDGGLLAIETENKEINLKQAQSSRFNLKPGSYLSIKVTDTGTGIESENLDKIFDPFFTTKELGNGTGLGLSAVYGAVIDHKGEIRINSRIKKGTSVEILLPLSNKEKEVATNSTLKQNINFAGKSVLIVDDEASVRVMTQNLLKRSGFNVWTAVDGLEAITLYQTKHELIDIVLLDVLLPVMGGLEVLEALKKINPDIKVLVLSGFIGDNTVNDFLEAGAKSFLQKPFRRRELIEKIDSVFQ